MWEIGATDEYIEWFSSLDSVAQVSLLSKILLLGEFGPQLGRPHVDTLKGSRHKNLKELRTRTPEHILRVLFIFDENRRALLLIGGDKKGKNQKDFYKRLMQSAETLIERYKLQGG